MVGAQDPASSRALLPRVRVSGKVCACKHDHSAKAGCSVPIVSPAAGRADTPQNRLMETQIFKCPTIESLHAVNDRERHKMGLGQLLLQDIAQLLLLSQLVRKRPLRLSHPTRNHLLNTRLHLIQKAHPTKSLLVAIDGIFSS